MCYVITKKVIFMLENISLSIGDDVQYSLIFLCGEVGKNMRRLAMSFKKADRDSLKFIVHAQLYGPLSPRITIKEIKIINSMTS